MLIRFQKKRTLIGAKYRILLEIISAKKMHKTCPTVCLLCVLLPIFLLWSCYHSYRNSYLLIQICVIQQRPRFYGLGKRENVEGNFANPNPISANVKE